MAPVPNIRQMEACILVSMYHLLVTEDEAFPHPAKIAENIDSGVSPAYTEMVLGKLEDAGQIAREIQDGGFALYSLSFDTVEWIQQQEKDLSTDIGQYLQDSEAWLNGTLPSSDHATISTAENVQADEGEIVVVPASDRIVSRDDNKPKIEKLEKNIDELLQDIIDGRQNDIDPEIEEAIIKIKSGRELIKGSEIKSLAVSMTLIEGLQKLSGRIRHILDTAEEVAFNLATEAWNNKVTIALTLALDIFGRI